MHINKLTLSSKEFPKIDRYPFNLDLFHKTKEIQFNSPVTFFMGENGTGKSTLLEAIAHKCNIHIWRNDFKNRLERNRYEDELYRHISIEWQNGSVPGAFFGADIFRDFAQYLDEWAVADPRILNYFGGKSLITQSHGQSLMSLFRTRYKIKGLYLLDEPETALSPKSQLELLRLIMDESNDGHAQFIIATHSPLLMACPDADIYSFNNAPVSLQLYEETEHYLIYKRFLENRNHFLIDDES